MRTSALMCVLSCVCSRMRKFVVYSTLFEVFCRDKLSIVLSSSLMLFELTIPKRSVYGINICLHWGGARGVIIDRHICQSHVSCNDYRLEFIGWRYISSSSSSSILDGGTNLPRSRPSRRPSSRPYRSDRCHRATDRARSIGSSSRAEHLRTFGASWRGVDGSARVWASNSTDFVTPEGPGVGWG